MYNPSPLSHIPVEAFQLMIDKNAKDVYRDMMDKRGIPRLELLTFALINTPIVRNEDGETVAWVSVWREGSLGTVSVCTAQGDWLDLIAVEDAPVEFAKLWRDDLWPDEAVRLFMKYHAAADDAAAKEQGE